MKLKAHAKINLTLEVLARRDDGYHQVRTILHELALCDILHLEEIPGNKIELICTDSSLPTNEENLVYQAAFLLQQRFAPQKGIRIKLIKRIPVAAGLGGGSSNAAAVLKGIRKLWGLPLTRDHLARLGAKIGSDVPFFLCGGVCLAEGRGELVRALPPIPQVKVLLVAPPGLKLSAGRVYGDLKLDKIPLGGSTVELLYLLTKKVKSSGDFWVEMGKKIFNHLEQPVFLRHQEVALLKGKLLACGLPALLSGSGPTVFALSRSAEKLERVGRTLTTEGYKVILTETIAGNNLVED